MHSLRAFFIITLGWMLTGCGSTSSLQVTSSPEKSTVYIRDVLKEKKIKIGETPLKISTDELEEKFQFEIAGPVAISVEKEGYITAQAFVTDVQSSNLNLNLNLISSSTLENSKETDIIITKLFECQKLVQIKNFKRALEILVKLKEKHKSVSVIHELEGGIHLLLKDYKMAYKSYLSAFKYNDSNTEALRMKKIIEEKYLK